MKPFYSVVIPISTRGEVLMGKRLEDGIWTTPAGGSEGEEDPIECAIREAKEEALLEIVPNQLEFLVQKVAKNGRLIWCFLFRCKQQYTTPEHDPDEEVKRWVWIDPIDFPNEFFNAKHKERRETILHALKKFYYLEGMGEEASDAQLSAIKKSSDPSKVYFEEELHKSLLLKLQT